MQLMPLSSKCSKKAFSKNVSRLVKEGRPQKQAVAIAYSVARKSGCRVKAQKGASCGCSQMKSPKGGNIFGYAKGKGNVFGYAKGKGGNYDQEIAEGMARAMFVTAWADEQEEKGRRFGGGVDLMDVAPKTSRDAKQAAHALAVAIVKQNAVKSLSDLYARALQAGGKGPAIEFGHYLAMQSMGHGVSWFDDNPTFDLKLPHFEYYSGRGHGGSSVEFLIGKSVGGYEFDSNGHTDRQKIGELMQQWHSSSGDPIYAVGSFFFTNRKYPKKKVVAAAHESIQKLLASAERGANGWGRDEVIQLAVILEYLDWALKNDYSATGKRGFDVLSAASERTGLDLRTGRAGGEGGGFFGGPKGSWIKPGDRVQWIDERGKKRSGRVVMRSSLPGSWVINTGGRHGTPAVVAESDIFGKKGDPMTGRAGGVGKVRKVLKSGWSLEWNPSRPRTVNVADEKNGKWSDSAIRYDDGRIAYDFPERIPDSVKAAVRSFYAEVRKAGRAGGVGGLKKNREGMTWIEWLRAAGVSESDLSFDNMPSDRFQMLRGAWDAGEDPTEYRSALAARRGRHDGSRAGRAGGSSKVQSVNYRRVTEKDPWKRGGARAIIRTSYEKLRAVLGAPMRSERDGDKVSTAWTVVDKTDPSKQFHVYDWKETVLYDRKYLKVSEVRSNRPLDWHVGSAASRDDIAVFMDWLAEKTGGEIKPYGEAQGRGQAAGRSKTGSLVSFTKSTTSDQVRKLGVHVDISVVAVSRQDMSIKARDAFVAPYLSRNDGVEVAGKSFVIGKIPAAEALTVARSARRKFPRVEIFFHKRA